MKNRLFTLLVLIAFWGLGLAQEPALITGTWGNKSDKVFLFKVEDGALAEIASSGLNEKKEFGFIVNTDSPGFYVVGQSAGREAFNFTFYIKPGDRLSIAVEGNTYALTGDANSPENKEMERWHKLVRGLERHAYYSTVATYVDFFPLLEEVVTQADNYTPEYPVSDAFAEEFRNYHRWDLMHIAVKFLYMPHSAHPQDEDMADYYNTVSLASISRDASILRYPYGLSLLRLVRMYTSMTASKNISAEAKKDFFTVYASLDRDLPQIGDEKLKGETVLLALPSIQTFEGLQDLDEKYGKYLVTEAQKARFRKVQIDKASNGRGQDAFDFRFKDANGKEIALSDFKGKVVYVDVWATWCAPCRKEFPHLKELEEEYKNKNIVFIGVSSDNVKDYDKWLKFLKDNSMGGIQLFAGDRKEDIMIPYKITGIPRFLLFGTDGKIVSSSAPRPSSSEIRPLLDELLKK